MRVFVTGSSGFVGRHLVHRLLAQGHDVDVLLRASSTRSPPPASSGKATAWVWDETTNGLIDIVKSAQPKAVCHVASLFIAEHKPEHITALIGSNVLFGTQLCEAMSAANVNHLINFGTSWQHYSNDGYNPVCLYAATKQAFEAILQYYIETKNLNVINLKLFDTYGPNDDRGKLFSTLMNIHKLNGAISLSPGEQQVDFVYIDDVIDAVTMALSRLMEPSFAGPETFAVSSGAPLSLRNFVGVIEKCLGSELNIHWGGRPYRSREVMTTWTSGLPVTGWTPAHSLEAGIRKAISSYV